MFQPIYGSYGPTLPKCTPGFMSHMLTVLKAYNEAEFPGWSEYDHAFRDKMALTGWEIGLKWMSTSIRNTVVPTQSKEMHSSLLPISRKPNPKASNLPMTARNEYARVTMNLCVNSHTSARTADTATWSDSALVLREGKVATWHLRELETLMIVLHYCY